MERNHRFTDRTRVILFLNDGESMASIARFLFMDKASVRNYKKHYDEGGLEKLVNDHYVDRISFLNDQLNDQEKEKLEIELESRIYPTPNLLLIMSGANLESSIQWEV